MSAKVMKSSPKTIFFTKQTKFISFVHDFEILPFVKKNC